MKKIVASVGLVALGASAVQTASAQGQLAAPTPEKPWNISATLRGFYDDNFNTLPDDFDAPGFERSTYGYEISPAASVAWSAPQTSVSLAYVYSYKYFENQPYYSTGKDSQSHLVNASLSHAFSERYQVSLSDSFVIGQEPDQLRAGNTYTTFQRVPGDNIRNYGNINFDAALTRELSLELGYANAYYDYDDSGATFLGYDINGQPIVGTSLSGILDRMEQYFHLDGRWKIQPETTALVGYQFGLLDFLADEPIYWDIANQQYQYSDIRNSRSHYGYVGVDHTFRPDLTASLRAGVRYTDYYNDPTETTDLSPYVRASGRYLYAQESYAELGFQFDKTATDLIGSGGVGGFTRDADTLTVFGSVTHRIMPKLFGSLVGQYQYGMYNGGIYDSETESIYTVGLNLEYRFSAHFAADLGYNYDLLDSEISYGGTADRGFDRNRVYLGVTARY